MLRTMRGRPSYGAAPVRLPSLRSRRASGLSTISLARLVAAACLAVLMVSCSRSGEHAVATVAPETPGAEGAPDTPEAAVSTEPSETVVYEITPDSLIGWTGYRVAGSQSGHFLLFEGQVEVPDGDVTRARMECLIEMESLQSANDTLTRVMKSDLMFHTDVYPQGRFVSRSVRKAGEGYEVTGVLDLMEVERTLTFPADIRIADGRFNLEATFDVDRTWWGITYKGIGENVMRDRATIRLRIVGEAAP